jgi:hypothetical protein
MAAELLAVARMQPYFFQPSDDTALENRQGCEEVQYQAIADSRSP